VISVISGQIFHSNLLPPSSGEMMKQLPLKCHWTDFRASLDTAKKNTPSIRRESNVSPQPDTTLAELFWLLFDYIPVIATCLPITHIQGVPGGKDLTSGECSLGQTVPI